MMSKKAKFSLLKNPLTFYILGYSWLLSIVIILVKHHQISPLMLMTFILLGLSCCLYANILWVKNKFDEQENIIEFDESTLHSASRSPLIHLSSLCTYIIPFSNFWLPTYLWFKHDEPLKVSSGIYVFNFQILIGLLLMAACILAVVVIGLVMFFVICILHIVFTLFMASKAYRNKNDKYPMDVNVLQTWIFYSKKKLAKDAQDKQVK